MKKILRKKIENKAIQLKMLKNVKPDDILIYEFDADKVGFQEARDYYNALIKEMPNKKIVGIPIGINISKVGWVKLYEYVMSIEPKGENP